MKHQLIRFIDHRARDAAQISAAAAHVRPEDMDAAVWISSDIGWFVERISKARQQGFDRIYLHEVGPEQERFVDIFGTHVLPHAQEP